MKIIKYDNCFLDTEISLLNDTEITLSDEYGIILGGWLFSLKEDLETIKKKYGITKVIIFNQEQYQPNVKFFHGKYIKMMKEADEVWDYDEYNIKKLKEVYGIDAKLHILKYTNKFDVIEYKYFYDVLFYGALSPRRKRIIDELKSKGINVICVNNKWGSELDFYIACSKILLNVHYYDTINLQEQARMIRWLGQKEKIISEKSAINYLNVEEVEYTEIVNKIVNKLKYEKV